MASVQLVKSAPDKLKESEIVINYPNFLEEVKECQNQIGRDKLTSVNNLRNVVSLVGLRYDEFFNPLLDVNLSKFQDRAFESLEDFSAIVVKVFEAQYPKMIDKVIESEIKKRGSGVDKVYYVGPESKLDLFVGFGFSVDKKGKSSNSND